MWVVWSDRLGECEVWAGDGARQGTVTPPSWRRRGTLGRQLTSRCISSSSALALVWDHRHKRPESPRHPFRMITQTGLPKSVSSGYKARRKHSGLEWSGPEHRDWL